MGLAAKMAAAQANQQQQQQPQQQGSFAPPGYPSTGYAAPPGAPPLDSKQQAYYPPPGAPPTGSSGYPQQQQHQQYGHQQPYGQPQQQQYQQQPQSSFDPRQIESVLSQAVKDQNLSAFYPPGSLAPIAQRVATSGALETVTRLYKLEKENAINIAKLALFDTALLLDDSGSMAFTKWNGERLDDLNLILSRVATTTALFDDDGIAVRFLNSERAGNVKNEQDAMNLLHGMEYKYQTPLGGALSKKILEPMLLGPAEAGRLQKPLLIIMITDGAPSDGDLIIRVIKDANSRLKRTRYGPDALSLSIAQVGTDLEAQNFLGDIDEDRTIGDLVDCTSGYELESEEIRRKTGKAFSPEEWLIKLLMGSVDSAYDLADESAKKPMFGGFSSGSHSTGGEKKKSGFRSLFGKK